MQHELEQRNCATEEVLAQLCTEHAQVISERNEQRMVLTEAQQVRAVLQSQSDALEQRG